ncbi:hypothetical protein CANARDRAFT_10032 [[Candida] arabinofermentans NRRL YB-2248]|uniref:Adenine deaminase n=1 Tax=[Candida] arabinofermentans NRRL YB-2248 TaxID=983967 RepID=A0A1E4STW0_9ASCO|nr:hypothetical protein CANARDRAFT_10032 [[Candida] arabinofermentans NRRL YB-2248]
MSYPNHGCSDEMKSFLLDLPKCEHHLHLEGTLGPELLFPLAKRNNISFPDDFPKTEEELADTYEKFEGLDGFLKYYYISMAVLITEQDFFDLAWTYFTRVHKEGLVHAEVFFDPQGHTDRGVHIDVVVSGFKKACIKAENELGISTKLIMCLLRHMPVSHCEETIQDSKKHFENGTIQGLGLDSSEANFPPELFIECYKTVSGFHPDVKLTAHAGEESGAINVVTALDKLNVTRIDHGINSVEDPELMKRLSDEKVMLTICPVSNWKIQLVKDISELPFQKLLDADVPFSINSDDPAYFRNYILDTFILVQKSFGWDMKTWVKISKNSIRGSWMEPERMKLLEDKVDQIYAKYN